MATKPAVSIVSLLLALLYAATGDKVAQKIYQDITAVRPCVVLTNATHQIGCTSSMNGHVGVLHYIENRTDVEWIIKEGKNHPYIALFRSDQFDPKMLHPLVESKMISGALVIAVPSGKHRYTPKEYSPDYECPNDNFGLYRDNKYSNCKELKWNKGGSGMSFKYYDIPIFALEDENEVEYILEQCYRKYNLKGNSDYPLCAAQLKDFMFAAKDTPTCIRKTNMPNPTGNEFCQPLGDMNVWGTLYPITKNKEVVMLATKLDSSSYFHDLAPGVENDGTGIIVALAAAKALGAAKRNGSISAPKNPIMFTFFQGESWDYVGSSRMVYDMEHGKFPSDPWEVDGEKVQLSTSNIKYFLELNQVGLVQDDPQLWAHSDPVSRTKTTFTNDKVQEMLTILEKAGKKYKVDIKEPKLQLPLPPASFQRFLRSNDKIPGIVLTDHEQQYSNKFYNSHFDDLYQVGGNFSREKDTVYLITEFTKKLTKISSTVATALYTLANDGNPPKDDIKADDALVGHLVYCLFNRSNCPLYREVSDSNTTWDKFNTTPDSFKPFPRYVSVNNTRNALTQTVYRLLLYFTGYHFPKSKDCSGSAGVANATVLGKDLQGICVEGSVFQSPAVSPAFLLEQYDSTEYSTWAESTWGSLEVRIFLVASPELQGITLGAGLIITFVSFVLVYFMNKKADLIFTPTNPPSSDLDS